MKSPTAQNQLFQNFQGQGDNLLYLWPILFWTVTMPLFMSSTNMWLGGIAITLALFLVAQYLMRRYARIDRVTNAYLSLVESGKANNGLDTLLKSGAAELSTRFEMNVVCRRICGRGKPHPNWLQEILPNARLLAFMKFCAKNQSGISTGADAAFVIAEFNGAFKQQQSNAP